MRLSRSVLSVRLVIALCVGAFPLTLSAAAVPEDAAPERSSVVADGSPVDFRRDVFPIFKQHCLHCHGPEREEGSLRLDRQEFAVLGGHTGRPILGGDAQTNAILQRITSDDTALRMPKEAAPLGPAEIDVLHRWIAAGAPWEDDPPQDQVPSGPASSSRTFSQFRFVWPAWEDLNPYNWSNEALQRAGDWFWTWGLIWIAGLICIGLSERAKLWVQQDLPRVRPPRGWLWRKLGGVSRSQYLAGTLLVLLGTGFSYYQEQAGLADAEVARLRKLNEELRKEQNPGYNAPGEPPRPRKLQHPPRLGGEYYRGNDERNPQLYNGGFYRTCTMRVWLTDAQGRRLHWGDAFPPDGAQIRFEIEQSPGAADQLFAEDIWKESFVSAVAPGESITDPAAQIIRFTVPASRTWVASYPITLDLQSNVPQTGIVYLYRGSLITDQPLKADPHYAAEYALRIDQGRIAEDSELWMGDIFRTGNVVVLPEGRIPVDEWFSFRPIPEIEGEQTTTDSKLLGIDDHRPKPTDPAASVRDASAADLPPAEPSRAPP